MLLGFTDCSGGAATDAGGAGPCAVSNYPSCMLVPDLAGQTRRPRHFGTSMWTSRLACPPRLQKTKQARG